MKDDKVYAVVGASTDTEKWGWKIFKSMKDKGFKVFPINPKRESIDGDKCYKDLESLSITPEMVIIVVPPKVTEAVVKECDRLGIKKVWMQPGSESDNAIIFCKDNDIEVTYNACFIVDVLDA